MHLTLVIPELLWPEPDDETAWRALACPGLERLLARSQLSRQPRRASEHVLSDLYGLPDGAPHAALRRAGERDGLLPEGHWLCADPVHLRFHHEQIVLADAGAFDVSMDEAQALVAALNSAFADLGTFYAVTPRRWYLHTPHSFGPQASRDVPPLSAINGRRMDGQLSPGPEAAQLHRWQNELQMFLHQQPINAQRTAEGLPAINGLWLWGAGTAQPTGKGSSRVLLANDPLARGIGRLCGDTVRPCPNWLAQTLPYAPNVTVVLDDLQAPVAYERPAEWQAALRQLEENWFAPLAQPGIAEWRIIAPTIYGRLEWNGSALDRWRLWRRPQPLANLARQLAGAQDAAPREAA